MEQQILVEKVRDFLQNEFLFEHCLSVGKTAQELLLMSTQEVIASVKIDRENADVNEKAQAAFIAGLLHDIGGIYPQNVRIEKAEQFGIECLAQEREFPLIIHQKLSSYLAQSYFDVSDEAILSAIECHTTLRGNFSTLDLIVFLADKISWDGGENAPFKKGLLAALSGKIEPEKILTEFSETKASEKMLTKFSELKTSEKMLTSANLELAALYYIEFIRAQGLKVAHPWLLSAQETLKTRLQS